MYTTEANIYTYAHGLRDWCSFVEKTYLIKISKKHIQAFYDAAEAQAAAQGGLKDFLSEAWRKEFYKKSLLALKKSKKFIERYHGTGQQNQRVLYDLILEATAINRELFIPFMASQEQYTRLVAEHVYSLFPQALSDIEKKELFSALTQSEMLSTLDCEAEEWNAVRIKLKRKFKDNIPGLHAYSFSELEKHAKKFGLLGTADELPAWTKESLHAKLLRDISAHTFFESIIEKKRNLKKIKKQLCEQYNLSRYCFELCHAIGYIGALRLELRIAGWMPMLYIISKEFFPQLEKFVPYTVRQLECMLPAEMEELLQHNKGIDPAILDERDELIFFGLYEGKEVVWSGDKALEMVERLVPSFEINNASVLSGQSGWKGIITAPCCVIRWDAEDVLKEIADMPEGAILIAGQTRPQLMPAIHKASAIVTDEGGLLSHAAIIARELKKPCVIGTKFATKVFKTGDILEVNGDAATVSLLKKYTA